MEKLSIFIATSHFLVGKLDLPNPFGKCLFHCQTHKHERFKVNNCLRFIATFNATVILPVNAVAVSTDALLVGDDCQVDLLEGC